MEFHDHLDGLGKAELRNFSLQRLASDPTPSTLTHPFYFNTVINRMKYWDGTVWIIIGDVGNGVSLFQNTGSNVQVLTIDSDNVIEGTDMSYFASSNDLQNNITDLRDETNIYLNQKASKVELQNAIIGLSHKKPVKVVSFNNINIAPQGNIQILVDDVPFDSGRILLLGQTNPANNGIYEGSFITGFIRAEDSNTALSLPSSQVLVEAGILNANTTWVCANDKGTVTLGTTPISFVKTSGSTAPIASQAEILAGTGVGEMVQGSDFLPTLTALGTVYYKEFVIGNGTDLQVEISFVQLGIPNITKLLDVSVYNYNNEKIYPNIQKDQDSLLINFLIPPANNSMKVVCTLKK